MNQKITTLEHADVDYHAEFQVFLEKENDLAYMIRTRIEKYGNSKIAVRHKPYGE